MGRGRRRSSIELICREKLNLKKYKNVQKRVRKALHELGRNAEQAPAPVPSRPAVKQRSKSRE